ncbi:MAG: hypothetical protein JWO07_865 [Candidatus Saccharibacteria bacterium]|nr:hypothetical protein [Candidatus Saccharibacteria bacterium]
MNFFKNKLQIFITVVFLAYFVWWLSFQSSLTDQGPSTQWFGSTYGVMALIASLIGFIASRKWGGFKTVLGKALLFISIALFLQEAGQLIYAYYIYVGNIQIPYPSWGDVAYYGSALSYVVGAFFLAKSVSFGTLFKASKFKFVPFIVPIIMLGISSFFFLYNHQYDFSNTLTVFLDFGYPITEAVYVSLALIAYLSSSKLLGGLMKSALLIMMFGFVVQYAADFSFLYASSRDSYLAGNGVDLTFLVAYFVAATAMIRFLATYNNLKQKTSGKVT